MFAIRRRSSAGVLRAAEDAARELPTSRGSRESRHERQRRVRIGHGKPVREADRIRAYELLLAYGWGKPPAFAAIEGADPLEQDEVAEAIQGLVAQLRAAKPPAL
jgi:hypothetical protein